MYQNTIALAGGPGRVVDVLWRTANRHGADLLLVVPENSTTTIHALATLSWDPRYTDGWRRYAWDIPPRRAGQPTPVVVIAGPEVEIAPAPATGTPLPPLTFVRLQRADYVPQEGEPPRSGGLLPLDLNVAASGIEVPDPFETAPMSLPQSDLAHVRFLPDGVVATHCDGNWEVRVTVDPRASSAFAFELVPAQMGAAHVLSRSAFHLRVVRRGPVTVEYRQMRTRLPVRPGFGVRGNDFSVVEVEVGDDDPAAPIPMSGLPMDRATRYIDVDPIPRYPEWETTVVNIVLGLATAAPGLVGGLAGFTPLVLLGTLVDFGTPLYCLITGRDLAGTEVSTDDIALMGAFALIGAALDYGPEFLRLARSLLDTLAPAGERAAVETALNPELARQLMERTSPMLAEAVRGINQQDAARLLQTMQTAATKGAGAALQAVTAQLTTILNPLLAKVGTLDGIPEPLYREAMAFAHVADAEAYLTLTAAERATVAGRYAQAFLQRDPGLLRLADISPKLAAEYTELVRDAIAQRVFNAARDGFRITSMDHQAFGTALGAGYEAYRLGKAAAGEKARDVIGWAYKQRSNSRYYGMLVAELGANFQAVLKPLVDRVRYAVDAAALKVYAPLVNTVDTFRNLRKLLTKKGLGDILEVDHILEQRFEDYFDGLLALDTMDYYSLAVPYNSVVVEGFKKLGLSGVPYTHTLKTARLKFWIPYTTEGTFTVQEIYDAYRLVYCYEFGLGERPLKGALEAIFSELWFVVREEAETALKDGVDITQDVRLRDMLLDPGLDTTTRTYEELRASVIAAQARSRQAAVTP